LYLLVTTIHGDPVSTTTWIGGSHISVYHR
jgi:hypothetical protein